MFNTLIDHVPIRVSAWLEGGRRAILMHGIVHVSPAMWELLSRADGDELLRLLESIEVLDLDAHARRAGMPGLCRAE